MLLFYVLGTFLCTIHCFAQSHASADSSLATTVNPTLATDRNKHTKVIAAIVMNYISIESLCVILVLVSLLLRVVSLLLPYYVHHLHL